MNYELAFKFGDRYFKNSRKLWYVFMPSSRKKIKENINCSIAGLKWNGRKNPNVFTFIKEGLKEKLNDCENDFFYDIEKLQEWVCVINKLSDRKMGREEYKELYNSFRFKKWEEGLDIKDHLKYLERRLGNLKNS